ncbi:MAG: hypothetical protein GW858_09490 [Sphingomonadales bacterium]|nr:hypothetical protein [Sphingomonadales bacterium]NCQ20557.1 hypothetical protein [Sphingomonadales bacterium]NCT04064.1 hypothetical protein [Sphingomonadales bacterium]
MSDRDSDHGDILDNLGRIAGGVGLLVIAAVQAIAVGRHRPKADIHQRPGATSLGAFMRRRGQTLHRKPPEAGLPVPAIPPRGPQPLQGGAAAPLEFGN